MRRGVVRHRRKADLPWHDGLDPVPRREALAANDECLVAVETKCIDELRAPARVVVELDPALVGDLASPGCVEGRLAELDEGAPVAQLLERTDLRQHLGLGEADELRAEIGSARELGGSLQLALPPGARDLAVLRRAIRSPEA